MKIKMVAITSAAVTKFAPRSPATPRQKNVKPGDIEDETYRERKTIRNSWIRLPANRIAFHHRKRHNKRIPFVRISRAIRQKNNPAKRSIEYHIQVALRRPKRLVVNRLAIRYPPMQTKLMREHSTGRTPDRPDNRSIALERRNKMVEPVIVHRLPCPSLANPAARFGLLRREFENDGGMQRRVQRHRLKRVGCKRDYQQDENEDRGQTETAASPSPDKRALSNQVRIRPPEKRQRQ